MFVIIANSCVIQWAYWWIFVRAVDIIASEELYFADRFVT